MPRGNPQPPPKQLHLRDDALRRLVEGLELRIEHFRRIGGHAAMLEVQACRDLQDRLDPQGRWCEALDVVDETMDDRITA